MMEVKSISGDVWEEVETKTIASCSGYKETAFLHYHARIGDVIYRRPSKAFDAAFKKEQIWAQLQQ